MPKRKSSDSPKSKKAKTGPSLPSIAEIETLEEQVIESSQYNTLVTLLSHYGKSIEHLKLKADKEAEIISRKLTVSLFKCFQKLFKDGLLVNRKHFEEKKSLIIKWLVDKYDTYKTNLFDLIQSKLSFKASVQLDALDIVLRLVKLELEYMGNSKDGFFGNIIYSRLIKALLLSENGEILPDGTSDDFIILEFLDTFKANWDLQAYSVNNLSELLVEWNNIKLKEELRRVYSNFFTLMKNQLLFNDELEELPKWISTPLPASAYKPNHFKGNFQRCFITILSYPLTTSQYKATLLVLHKRIIPYMIQPQSLMDFLTECYEISDDSTIPILALNSLYELMKKFNLEYPDFYTKLYSLLTPELLYSRYRSRFFRLCDLFLTSTHLSANLVASFIKKLARLSLSSTASGVVIVIPFIYNLLKRHPSCMIMVHNANPLADYQDPFINSEPNPLFTKAIGSSLWELESLMSHYHPNIATLAKIFGEPFRKHSYNMEDFLDWSYITLLDSEKTRRYKSMAALEFEEYNKLFEGGEEAEGSVYAEGWTL
ncbi:CBF-domain-containing protein [Suhomyces tanzawaensis NRRL Y-17324]|uniref:CBF-domain-containing protein n=1 Tax=Suhomyces tanzawaensis NRRL Y-17324 TaxID=984487 RepID=A0A1E4SR74_9ASCO|nr:CBF-domain-containing protein [Suhomyces tanzawaensis NRRL Y-17324]ODV82009.1 CBF-domain-containing protein [Suhomyces tanzawaensis NRRL Y-17324]